MDLERQGSFGGSPMLHPQKDHNSYMWHTKLEENSQFLLVLEFLPLQRTKFKHILSLLQPEAAEEFFTHQIEQNPQFLEHARKPKLGYWRFRGLAAPIRYMLAHCDVEFDDVLYEQKENDGTEEVSYSHFNDLDWAHDRDRLGLELPNLPYFIDRNTKLTDPQAIMKFIAMKYAPELLGSTPIEKGYIEQAASVVGELRITATLPCYTDGNRTYILKATKTQMDSLQVYLKNRKYLAGDKVCHVDFVLYELLELLNFVLESKILQQGSVFNEYHTRVGSLPRLQHYRQNATAMPFNSKNAKINNLV